MVNEYQSIRVDPALALEGGRLVVQAQVAARAQNCLAQPLQTERQEQRADDQPEGLDRDVSERRPEQSHEHSQHHRGGTHPLQGRAPATDDPHRKHDRERLDRLHSTGCEDSYEEHGGRAHRLEAVSRSRG
jgi:hypothetical protein